MDIKLLKERKKHLHLSYDENAQKSGIPKTTITNIFMGRTQNPRIDTMQAIEKALGLSTSSMPASAQNTPPAGFENMPELLSEKRFGDIAKIYHALADEYREKILTVATVIALSVGLDIEQVLKTTG